MTYPHMEVLVAVLRLLMGWFCSFHRSALGNQQVAATVGKREQSVLRTVVFNQQSRVANESRIWDMARFAARFHQTSYRVLRRDDSSRELSGDSSSLEDRATLNIGHRKV